MAKVLMVLLCVAILHTAIALECYTCVSGSGDKNCEELNDESKIRKETCGRSITEKQLAACYKKVTEEKSSKARNMTRGCAILPQDSKTDTYCKPPSAADRYDMPVCEICFTDLCNAGTNLNVNFLTLLGTSTLLFFKFLY